MKRTALIILVLLVVPVLGGCYDDPKYGNVSWYGPDGVHTWEGAKDIEVKDNGRLFFQKDRKTIMIYGNVVVESN